LTYGDQDFPGTPRTQTISAWTTPKNLGTNNIYAWTFSTVNDETGSYVSANGDLGSPGQYIASPAVTGG